jgi:transposase
MGGKPPVLPARERAWILYRIRSPDLSLRARRRARMARRGRELERGVWTFVHREGLSFKKAWPLRGGQP